MFSHYNNFLSYIQNLHYWLSNNSFGIAVSGLLVMSFALMIRSIFSSFVMQVLNVFGLEKYVYGQKRFLNKIAQSISFIPIVFGVYFALEMVNIPRKFLFFTHNFFKSLYAFNVTWLVFTFIDPIAFVVKKSNLYNSKSVLLTWVVRVIKFFIVLIGASVILKFWNVNVGTLIASLGIVGMAVALGAQDLFKNVISGIAIIGEKRFGVGDIIKIQQSDDFLYGVVENIGFRSTAVRKFDRTLLYIPNSTVADTPVINYASRMYREIYWTINLEHRTTADQLRYILTEIRNYATENKDFVQQPEEGIYVHLEKFNDYSIQVMLWLFANTNNWSEMLVIKERLILKIKEIVEKSGANFAMPTRSLFVEKTDNKFMKTDLPKDLKKILNDKTEKSNSVDVSIIDT